MLVRQWSVGDVVAYFRDDGTRATTSPVLSVSHEQVKLADGMTFPMGAQVLVGARGVLDFYDVHITSPDDPAFTHALARAHAHRARRSLERAVNLWRAHPSTTGVEQIAAAAAASLAADAAVEALTAAA